MYKSTHLTYCAGRATKRQKRPHQRQKRSRSKLQAELSEEESATQAQPPAEIIGGDNDKKTISGQLLQLLDSTLPGPARLELVDTCLGHMQVLVQQILGEDTAVTVKGSYAQGLALLGSDLDVAVVVPSSGKKNFLTRTTTVPKGESLRVLHRLAEALSTIKSPEMRLRCRIFSARVPILRLNFVSTVESTVKEESCSRTSVPEEHDVDTVGYCKEDTVVLQAHKRSFDRISVDIAVCHSLEQGACDRHVKKLLQRNGTGLAAALCRLVKLWAGRRQLTDTRRGGLSSFGFILMVIFFMQQLPVSSRPNNLLCLGGSKVRVTPGKWHDEQCPKQLGRTVGGASAEAELWALLGAFFRWSAKDLPKLAGYSLSVMTGKATRLPLLTGGSTGGTKCGREVRLPVLEVPLGSTDENAARCLRASVWDSKILPEFRRGHRLTRRMTPSKECDHQGLHARVVRTLFAPLSDGFTPLPSEDEIPTADFDGNETEDAKCEVACEPATVVSRRRLQHHKLSCRTGLAVKQSTMEYSKKRRRKREHQMEPERLASGLSPPMKTLKAVAAAPVRRFLDLRSLLNPDTVAGAGPQQD